MAENSGYLSSQSIELMRTTANDMSPTAEAIGIEVLKPGLFIVEWWCKLTQ